MKKVKPENLIPGIVYRDNRYPYVGKFRFINREKDVIYMKPVNEVAPCYQSYHKNGYVPFPIDDDPWNYYVEDNIRLGRNTLGHTPRFESR